MFQIVRLALDDNGEVDARRPLQPLFELREDAMAMAEFERRGCGATTAATKSGTVGGRPTRAGANTASSSNRSPPPTPRRELAVPSNQRRGFGKPSRFCRQQS